MFTRCPECQTVFRLRPEQLRVAQGQVRCSRCDTIFDALDHLYTPRQRPVDTTTSEPFNREAKSPTEAGDTRRDSLPANDTTAWPAPPQESSASSHNPDSELSRDDRLNDTDPLSRSEDDNCPPDGHGIELEEIELGSDEAPFAESHVETDDLLNLDDLLDDILPPSTIASANTFPAAKHGTDHHERGPRNDILWKSPTWDEPYQADDGYDTFASPGPDPDELLNLDGLFESLNNPSAIAHSPHLTDRPYPGQGKRNREFDTYPLPVERLDDLRLDTREEETELSIGTASLGSDTYPLPIERLDDLRLDTREEETEQPIGEPPQDFDRHSLPDETLDDLRLDTEEVEAELPSDDPLPPTDTDETAEENYALPIPAWLSPPSRNDAINQDDLDSLRISTIHEELPDDPLAEESQSPPEHAQIDNTTTDHQTMATPVSDSSASDGDTEQTDDVDQDPPPDHGVLTSTTHQGLFRKYNAVLTLPPSTQVQADNTECELDPEHLDALDEWYGEPPSTLPATTGYALEPEEATQHGAMPTTLLWGAGILILSVILGLQILHSNASEMGDHAALRPLLERLCHYTDCPVPPQRDLERIRLASHMVQFHPRFQDSLLITATLINRAEHVQPFPAVELQMTDLQQRVIASRRFQPSEYLVGQNSDRPMPSNVEIPLLLEVIDPGREVVGFRFEFH